MRILIDVGGTTTRIAASTDGTTIGEPIKFDTIENYSAGLETLIARARELVGSATPEMIAVGFKAVISPDKRVPLTAPQGILNDWKDKPLADDLEKALGGRAIIVNDTALVGLGEAVYGAGRGAKIVAYVTVSTGVNGARITEGTIDETAQGFEMGHQYLAIGPEARTLESLVSGTAIEQRFGKHPRDLGKDDPLWEELAETLAYGIYNAILEWSPNRVVIGGSMMNDIGISVDRVAAHLARINTAYPELPALVHAELGDEGGLWGGLALS